jgi:hypothetical protein
MSASAVFATALSLDQDKADLGACDGMAKLVKTSDGKAELRISGVRRCSNMTIQMKLDRNSQGEYAIKLPLDLGKDADVQLSSNTGSTSAQLHVSTTEMETAPELYASGRHELLNCIGSVRFEASYSKPATMRFENVKNCSHFSIVSVNGHSFEYDKKLQDQGTSWGGSFTLPATAIHYGHNRVKISLEGPMNKDQFILVFDSYQN